MLIVIKDSVDALELPRAHVTFDPELKIIGELTIQEGSNGVRSAVIRTPVGPGLKLIRKKRTKVSWAECRIKEIDKSNTSCARCLVKRHTTKECVGTERRKYFVCKEPNVVIVSDYYRGFGDDPCCAESVDHKCGVLVISR